MKDELKTYCVCYNTIHVSDVSVKAKNKKEAEEKVKEIIPDAQIEETWEVTK